MRAHRPRRFGTTASSRPPDASTRQISRSSAVGSLRHFQRMHQQHAIDRGIRQRQLELIDQRRQRGLARRPFHHALRGRHEGEACARPPRGTGRDRASHSRCRARAGRGVSPQRAADAAADEMPRHRAEPLDVEIAQIDDVDGHGANCTMNARRGSRGVHAEAGRPTMIRFEPDSQRGLIQCPPKPSCSAA